MYCSHCGKEINHAATACSHCGYAVVPNMVYPCVHPILAVPPQRTFTTTLAFALFFGLWGGHRFYTGHTATAVIQLFTLGGLGMWTFIDIVLIVSNNFYDREGRALDEYDFLLGVFLILLFALVDYVWLRVLIGFGSNAFSQLNNLGVF